jgi:hypothetical protein
MALYLNHKTILYNAFFNNHKESLTFSELRDYYSNLYNKLQLEANIKYIVLKDDLDDFLDSCDIFIKGIDKIHSKRRIRLEDIKRVNKYYPYEVKKVLEANCLFWGPLKNIVI